MPRTKLDKSSDVVYLAKKPEELEAFITWKATPKDFRDPPSQKKLAVVLGVTERTLINWNHDPRVMSKVEKLASVQPLVDALPDVISTIIEIATDPSHPKAVMAAKSYFELLHRQTTEPDSVDLESMSLDELKQHVVSLYDIVDDRERAKNG